MDQHGIDIVGAWIDGVVDLSYVRIGVPVILSKCRIPDGIKLTSAELSDLELVVARSEKSTLGRLAGNRLRLAGRG